MLTDEMKEIVLRVAQDCVCPCGMQSKESLLEFTERFLAALPKPEPVGEIGFYGFQWTQHGFNTVTPNGTLLYAAPPLQDTAAVEQRVAGACAKLVSRCQFSGSSLAKQTLTPLR